MEGVDTVVTHILYVFKKKMFSVEVTLKALQEKWSVILLLNTF